MIDDIDKVTMQNPNSYIEGLVNTLMIKASMPDHINNSNRMILSLIDSSEE